MDGVRRGGGALCEVRKGDCGGARGGVGGGLTTQTDMLTANTNTAKQMVHAHLFRLPFKRTPQLGESAPSCVEGRTYQLPSSLLTLKRPPFTGGTMGEGFLLSPHRRRVSS